MEIRMLKFIKAMLGAAALAAAVPAAANTILLDPTAFGTAAGTVTVGGTTYDVVRYTYDVNLNIASTVSSSDPAMFTLLDISGYVGGSAAYTASAGGFNI